MNMIIINYWTLLHSSHLFIFLKWWIFLLISRTKANNFDNTRQGGDKAMPTPMSSAVWWLMMNSSSLPISVWSTNPTTNTTLAPYFWPSIYTNVSSANNGSLPSNITAAGSKWITDLPSTSTVSSQPVTTPVFTTPIFPTAPATTTVSPVMTSQQSRQTVSTWPVTNTISTEATVPVTVSESSTVKTSSVPIITSSSARKEPPTDLHSTCRHYDESELYGILMDEGAYNQYFMANSPDEVGHLPWFKLQDDTTGNINGQSGMHKRMQRSLDTGFGRPCIGRCKKISTIVLNALEDLDPSRSAIDENSVARDTHKSGWINTTNDATLVDSKSSNVTNTTTARPTKTVGVSGLCALEHFIPIGECDQRAEEEYFGLDRLCTACRGVYKLPRGCFPQFLNAITCNSTDIQCIFDVWTKSSHGVCREKTISFTVMHNLGNEQCQEWRFETVEVPIGCQCYLNKSSWLKA